MSVASERFERALILLFLLCLPASDLIHYYLLSRYSHFLIPHCTQFLLTYANIIHSWKSAPRYSTLISDTSRHIYLRRTFECTQSVRNCLNFVVALAVAVAMNKIKLNFFFFCTDAEKKTRRHRQCEYFFLILNCAEQMRIVAHKTSQDEMKYNICASAKFYFLSFPYNGKPWQSHLKFSTQKTYGPLYRSAW